MSIVIVIVMSIMVHEMGSVRVVEGMWCVARSDATDSELQSGLDYACAAGADCAPIKDTGLCFLPNTLQAHASYAYNSFYQRSNMAPDSCHFSATATLAKTDPSYGSCVFPASPSTAGGGGGGMTPSTTTPINGVGFGFGGASPLNPATTISSPTNVYGGGMNPTNMGPPISTSTTDSQASVVPLSAALLLLPVSLMSLFLLL